LESDSPYRNATQTGEALRSLLAAFGDRETKENFLHVRGMDNMIYEIPVARDGQLQRDLLEALVGPVDGGLLYEEGGGWVLCPLVPHKEEISSLIRFEWPLDGWEGSSRVFQVA